MEKAEWKVFENILPGKIISAVIKNDSLVVLDVLEEIENMLSEYFWLTDKFGDGVYADVLGLCKAADISEIEAKGWSLTPGAYVGVAPVEDDGVDFAERMAEIPRELLKLQAESNELMETISKNMREMGL